MGELVSYENENKIATITLHNGKVNAISHELIAEFNAALDQAEADKSVVILTSRSGLLSGGYDLKQMSASMEAAMALVTEGSTLSHRMMSFPFPIIAACPGHAVAKGAFLLLSSDYRIGVEGDFKIGLNETAIGMTMHHAGIDIARERLSPNYFTRSVMGAEMFKPEEAVTAGFLDKVVPAEQLMPAAQVVAEYMKTLQLKAFAGTKVKARTAFLEKLQQSIEIDSKGSLR